MEIRDNRQKEWFWLDNEYLNGYARILGVYCTAVYISLCRHADNKTQTCFPSMKLIAEENSMSTKTVERATKTLEEWGIVKVERSKKEDGTQANNIYTLTSKRYWKKKPTDSQSIGIQQTLSLEPTDFDDENRQTPVLHNNTHINNTQLTIQAKQVSQEIPLVIKEFEKVNKACADFYGNTTQRKALQKLIDAYGYEKVMNVVSYLPKLNRILYNKATTPVELWNKWAKIEAEASKLKDTKLNSKYAITTTY